MNENLEQPYMMPPYGFLSGGDSASRGTLYREVDTVSLTFESDANALTSLLPGCYAPAEPPLVTLMFSYYGGVDFMAGRGYSIAAAMAQVRFEGTKHNVSGSFALVIFEDETLPIILGREMLGVAKVYGDISPIVRPGNGHLRCEASLWGHLLFGIDLDPVDEQKDPLVGGTTEGSINDVLLGYRYIPSVEGPADAFPIATPTVTYPKQLWKGNIGSVYFGNPEIADVGPTKGILDMLKKLPILSVTDTSRIRGSLILGHEPAYKLT